MEQASLTWSQAADLMLAREIQKALDGQLRTDEVLRLYGAVQGGPGQFIEPFPLDISGLVLLSSE
jgi:hypothetical protein